MRVIMSTVVESKQIELTDRLAVKTNRTISVIWACAQGEPMFDRKYFRGIILWYSSIIFVRIMDIVVSP